MSTLKTFMILGCGGHARSVADVALSNGVEQLIFVDDNARPQEKIWGFPVVKNLPLSAGPVIIAIGDNHQRAALFATQQQNVTSLIAISAHIGKKTQIAQGVFIASGAHIGPNTTIGANTIINTHAVVEHDCMIGNHCHISVNATVAGKCELGDFVMLGVGATVIDGLKICSNVIIGAGAVVINDIPQPGTYVGVPARKIC